jgi:hypothetical protein
MRGNVVSAKQQLRDIMYTLWQTIFPATIIPSADSAILYRHFRRTYDKDFRRLGKTSGKSRDFYLKKQQFHGTAIFIYVNARKRIAWNHVRRFVFLTRCYLCNRRQISHNSYIHNVMYTCCTHFSFVSGDTRERTDISHFDRNFISRRVNARPRVCKRGKTSVPTRTVFNIKQKEEKGKRNRRANWYALTYFYSLTATDVWLTNIYRAQLCTPLTGASSDTARSSKV